MWAVSGPSLSADSSESRIGTASFFEADLALRPLVID
jgi:hypothetical protein